MKLTKIQIKQMLESGYSAQFISHEYEVPIHFVEGIKSNLESENKVREEQSEKETLSEIIDADYELLKKNGLLDDD